MHYSRWKAHGDPVVGAKVVQGAFCSVEDCVTAPLAKGLCRKHYYAAYKAERHPKVARQPKVKKSCSVEDCAEDADVRGWCGAHYQRWRRFGDPTHMPDLVHNRCEIEGCEKVTNARGLCSSHYYRWQHYGDPLGGQAVRVYHGRAPLPDRVCIKCGSTFNPGASSIRKYCSRRCSVARRGGSVNRRAWVDRLGKRDGWTCHLCGDPVDPSLYWPARFAGSVDHIVPVILGGTDSADNLALAHLTCNCKRTKRTLIEDD